MFEEIVFSHLVKSPRRTDGQDIVAFTFAFLLVVVVGDEAGLVGLHSSGAVPGEVLDCELRHRGDQLSIFRSGVPGIFKGIVVAGVEMEISDDSAGIGLNERAATSRENHLSPYLAPWATLLVVGTC